MYIMVLFGNHVQWFKKGVFLILDDVDNIFLIKIMLIFFKYKCYPIQRIQTFVI